jgi:hypothetical protein
VVVYTSWEPTENQQSDGNVPPLFDPSVLRAARQIYRAYQEAHPNNVAEPLGVAIDCYTLRGQLIFNRQPALLPQECFVPFSHLESDSNQ